MKKLKDWFSQKKNKLMVVLATAVPLSALSAFAVDESPAFDLSATMTTAVSKIVSDLTSMIGAVVPIAVTLLGASIGIIYGIRFIKKIIGKAN